MFILGMIVGFVLFALGVIVGDCLALHNEDTF